MKHYKMSADPWDGDPRNPENEDNDKYVKECLNCRTFSVEDFCDDWCKQEYREHLKELDND